MFWVGLGLVEMIFNRRSWRGVFYVFFVLLMRSYKCFKLFLCMRRLY